MVQVHLWPGIPQRNFLEFPGSGFSYFIFIWNDLPGSILYAAEYFSHILI